MKDQKTLAGSIMNLYHDSGLYNPSLPKVALV